MSSNQRPDAVVGAGTNRRSDEQEYTINEGWNFFQKDIPDNSVIDSEEFSSPWLNPSADGPYYFNIPGFADKYVDPSSLRLKGKCKIVYKLNNVIQDGLPKREAGAAIDPFAEKEIKFKQVLSAAPDREKWLAKQAAEQLKDNIIPLKLGPKQEDAAFVTLTMEPARYSSETAKVVPVNLMCQAMWKDIEIKMNGTTITQNSNLEYAHKAYIETLLTYGNEALTTHMQAEMWDPDDPEEIEEYTPQYWNNNYHKTRSFHAKRKKYSVDNEFEFSMQLHTELNSISSFLPDKIQYQFKFTRNSPEFYLRQGIGQNTDPGSYTVQFTDLKLCGRFMIPSDAVKKDFDAFIRKTSSALKTVRTDIVSGQILAGQKQFLYNNIFNKDTLPDQIFICLIDQNAKTGTITSDPFFFETFGLDTIKLRVNNKDHPLDGLNPDWSTDRYMKTYRELYENVSVKTNNTGLSITPKHYKYGSTIFAWDLNHDNCAGAHSNHGELIGRADLHLNFKNALTNNVCVMVAAVYRDFLSINEDREASIISAGDLEELRKQNKIKA